MDKRIVKSFKEFIDSDIPQEGDEKKKDDNMYLNPDTQNPTSQEDDDPLLVGYPFGGL
jgi:hypothetical protein